MTSSEHVHMRSDLKVLLGERLRWARLCVGLSQERLLEHLPISIRSYSRWECGEVEPSASALAMLADELDVSVDVLLGRQPSSNELGHKPWIESRRRAARFTRPQTPGS